LPLLASTTPILHPAWASPPPPIWPPIYEPNAPRDEARREPPKWVWWMLMAVTVVLIFLKA
jgi:hypothetical protein